MSSEKEDFWVIYGRWACQITLHQIAKEERQLQITKEPQSLKNNEKVSFFQKFRPSLAFQQLYFTIFAQLNSWLLPIFRLHKKLILRYFPFFGAKIQIFWFWNTVRKTSIFVKKIWKAETRKLAWIWQFTETVSVIEGGSTWYT